MPSQTNCQVHFSLTSPDGEWRDSVVIGLNSNSVTTAICVVLLHEWLRLFAISQMSCLAWQKCQNAYWFVQDTSDYSSSKWHDLGVRNESWSMHKLIHQNPWDGWHTSFKNSGPCARLTIAINVSRLAFLISLIFFFAIVCMASQIPIANLDSEGIYPCIS